MGQQGERDVIGLLGSLVGARGGRMLGGMIGGRTGAMVGGLLGSLVGSRQLGRLARSVMDRGGDDGGDGLDGVLSDDDARLLVSMMSNSAKADGQVDQDEADRIAAQIGDNVTADERSFLRSQLSSPFVAASEIAATVPADLSAEAYAVSLLAVDVDTAAESAYLSDLAAALGLEADDVAEIHAELGVDV